MPELVLVAQNVVDAPSVFVLEGVERKINDDVQLGDEVIVVDLRDEWHVVITISTEPDSISPGELLAKRAEIDYDVRSLQWRARADLRGRFLLREFRWGDHALIKQEGIV
ncbi:MAG: hypothetical protein IH885_04485 [Myxococcales bacterium]|nr:hypothetical protein [Myxococcales bacterium]